MTLRPAGATAVASATVILAGLGTLWHATDGLAAFTAEGARRLAVETTPRPVPAAAIVTGDGRVVDLPVAGRPLLVEFIYTSCPTICTSLGQEFLQIQQALSRRGLGGRVHLMSLSFDLDRDTPAMLAAYAAYHGADPAIWTVGRPQGAGALRSLLDAFGVTVIPDADGAYVHNAAIHYVGADGRLARIFDLGEVDAVVSFIESAAP